MADTRAYGVEAIDGQGRAPAVDKSRLARKWPADVGLKRAMDIAGACVLLVLLAPLMLVLATLVRRDGGSAVYRHRRIGADGSAFDCLKFRSMCADADQRLRRVLEENPAARLEWERTFKLRDDPRITSIGRFLRRTSLDELPQLFNVLRGEMSLVGPRPIVREEVPRYGGAFVYYQRCRPGITGPWQVSGRSDTSYTTRVALDAHYARQWSLGRDVAILFRTVGVVLRGSGAY